MEPLFRGHPWDQGKCNLKRNIPWMEVGLRFVNSRASASAKCASIGAQYLNENGNLSMPEKFGSKLSCSCTATTKAILVKFAKMVIEFEYFATPWKFDAKFPIFVRFSVFVNFTTLWGVPLVISIKLSPTLSQLFFRDSLFGHFRQIRQFRDFYIRL